MTVTTPSVRESIEKERKMLNFQRLAGTKKIRSYNLAEHSYFVGLMFQEFAEEFGIEFDEEILGIVLRHDFMEVFTCDLPWQVKHLNEETESAWDKVEQQAYKQNRTYSRLYPDYHIHLVLTDEQYCLFKWCDMLELLYFCLEEYEMGNHGEDIMTVIDNCFSDLKSGREYRYKWEPKLFKVLEELADKYGFKFVEE